MRDQSAESDGSRPTHQSILRELADGWELSYPFVRAVVPTHREREDLSLLEALAGKIPDKVGPHRCDYCDEPLHALACDDYRERVGEWFRREVIEPYLQPTCPRCETPIEEFRRVNVVEPMGDAAVELSTDSKSTTEVTDVNTEVKEQYQPCGHRFDPDRATIRGDIDRTALRDAVDNGQIAPLYDGPVIDPSVNTTHD